MCIEPDDIDKFSDNSRKMNPDISQTNAAECLTISQTRRITTEFNYDMANEKKTKQNAISNNVIRHNPLTDKHQSAFDNYDMVN